MHAITTKIRTTIGMIIEAMIIEIGMGAIAGIEKTEIRMVTDTDTVTDTDMIDGMPSIDLFRTFPLPSWHVNAIRVPRTGSRFSPET